MRTQSSCALTPSPFPTPLSCTQDQRPGFDVKLAGFRNKPGGKVPEFLVDGKRLTAEEMVEDAARALRAADEASAAAEAAAREAEAAEAEARRLQGRH